MRLLFSAWALTVCSCELVDPVSRLEQGDDATVDATADALDASDAQDVATGCGDGNPCAAIAQKGCYCGATTQAGFDPGQATINCLYLCEGGTVSATVYCASGCIVESAGTQDQCAVTGTRCY